jgi:hypothetical protein
MDSDPALEDRSRGRSFLRSLRSIHNRSVWMMVVRRTVSLSMGRDCQGRGSDRLLRPISEAQAAMPSSRPGVTVPRAPERASPLA